MARATGSLSKAARSALDPPPRTTTTRSQPRAARVREARAIELGAPAPWTEAGTTETEKAKPEASSWPTKSR